MKKIIILIITLISLNIYSLDTGHSSGQLEQYDKGFTKFEYYYKVFYMNRPSKLYINEFRFNIGLTSFLSSRVKFESRKIDDEINSYFTVDLYLTPLSVKYMDLMFYSKFRNDYFVTVGSEIDFKFPSLSTLGAYIQFEMLFMEHAKYGNYSYLGAHYSFLDDFGALIEFDLFKPYNENLFLEGIMFTLEYKVIENTSLVAETYYIFPHDDNDFDYLIKFGIKVDLP